MPYLIDGHNLIPKIPGLSLQSLDDEEQLIKLLQDFCRIQRKSVEVYFDGAPPGQARQQRHGQVSAIFVRQGLTADAAIRQRLLKLGKAASQWTVVSSDHAVQDAARLAHAQSLSSEEFSRLLQNSLAAGSAQPERGHPPEMSPSELAEWMHLFGQEADIKKKGRKF
jgi:hypothetical protein